MTKVAPQRISREELVNSLTHGLGFALSVVGFAVLLILAILHGSALRIVSCSVHGFTLVLSRCFQTTAFPHDQVGLLPDSP